MLSKFKRNSEAGEAAGKSAIVYLTVGSLLLIWSIIGLFYASDTQDGWGAWHYVLLGFALTGVVLVILGASIGRITRSAREAELPPESEARADGLEDGASTPARHPPIEPARRPSPQ